MNEKNPLQIYNVPPKVINNRGRPSLEKMIKFGPQPKSIISQLLKKIEKQKEEKTKSNNTKMQQLHRNKISFRKINDINLQNTTVYQSGKEYINAHTKSNRNETLQLNILDDSSSYDYDLLKNSKHNDLESTILLEVHHKRRKMAHDDDHIKESDTEIKEIFCEVCSHRSINEKEHRKHLITHKDKQYICDYPSCSYVCKLSSNLIKHKRIHSSEKPYICDQCPFRSKFVNSLKVHKRIHTSERPYACKHCNYKCNSSSNLKKHCLHRHPEVLDLI